MLQIAHRAGTVRSDPVRHEMQRGAAAMTAMLAGIVPLGLVVGATAAEHRAPGAAFASTWALYGASAQLAFLDLTNTGASALLTLATCLLINARLVVYSASMAGHWRGEGTRFKALAAATIVDPSFALGDARYREPGRPAEQRAYYVGAAATLWIGWTAAIVAGAIVGAQFTHVAALQLALPICLVPLVAPVLATRPGAATVVTAAAVGVATREWPAGSGLLLAIVAGAVAGTIVERRRP